jgi:hypothetical protein
MRDFDQQLGEPGPDPGRTSPDPRGGDGNMIEWKYDRNGTAQATVDEAVLFVPSGWPDPEKPWAWLVKNKRLDPGYPSQLAKDQKAAEPRRFFSGYDGSQRAVSKENVEKLLKERPGASVLCFTVPTYVSWSTTRDKNWYYPHITLAPIADGKRDNLEAERKAGKEFWFVDAAVAGHEQSGRFTFGFWLWKLGARGRFTFLSHYGHRAYGDVYYSLVGGSSANNTQPLMPALDGGVNPARSLILIREGIDDYRYIHTLEMLLNKALPRHPGSVVVQAAKKYCDELAAELNVDLSTYYEAHFGSDGGHGAEYWHPLAGNLWRSGKFSQVRREAARHIVALKQLLSK